MNENIKSAARVLDILELLSAVRLPLGANEIARRLALPRSSAAVLLGTLLRRGYLRREADGRYGIANPLTSRWVGGYVDRLTRIAPSVLRRAAERSGESVFLGVLTPAGQVQMFCKAISPDSVRFDIDIAMPRPAHAVSLGHVLLAFARDELVRDTLARPLERFADGTETDPAAMFARLKQIRIDGYAVSLDGHLPGASGVSVPVRGDNGEVVAGLNIASPTFRFAGKRDDLIAVAREAAALLAAQLASDQPSAGTPEPRHADPLTANH